MPMNELVPQDISGIADEIEKAFLEIPFGNSAFQNVHFVMNQQFTPERAYRAIGLRLSNRLRALKESYFNRQLEEVDIAELEEKRENPSLTKFDRSRAEIELQKKLSNRPYVDKLIGDAVAEVNTLYAEFRKFPRFTREQFETGERRHFEVRLQHQINGVGDAAQALLAMQHEVTAELEALPGPQGPAGRLGAPE